MQYQQHPSSGVITLPLLKFSAANDEPAEATNFSWKHTTQNLMVHFDTFSGAAGSHIMKVLQGTHNVLSVDLQEKISACSQVIDTMRQHNIEIRNEQLPISALVRCPLFAFRYNLPDRKVRRVQLKFASNEGFEMAYNHLSRLGLRITQSVPPSTTTKPASSNNNTPSTFSHAPQAAIIAERPHTAQDTSSRPSSSAMEPPPIPIRSETSGSARPSNIIFNLPPLPRPTLVREMNKENEAVRDSIQSTSQSFHPLRNMTQNTQQSQPSLQSQFTNPTNAENPTPFVDRVISHIIAQGSSGTEQLANYAKRPSDERAPALDDYLLQYLEDESFVTLCEDVSACWRRICFED
ncbi:hypothetical protein GQ43DRAFT_366511 [Delitschia confertaspora ATCC 74209]|uniref:Uncharacterized protein n=1 Tax=Delitschia confertaspora ATCC 74209 TaxID=1513339 RepID=A0A9P4JPX6_9PLEO|nr:hypothetical protein GQ43DRAFT_366511 [Delitschia confertaspora ATCC 74209]